MLFDYYECLLYQRETDSERGSEGGLQTDSNHERKTLKARGSRLRKCDRESKLK